MSIQVNTLFNNIVSKVDSYKSELLNSDAQDFSSYLKDGFNSIDEDKNSNLSKNEILKSVEKENKNPELQKILDNKNIESLMSNIDTNSDGSISKTEVNPNGNLPNILKSAYNDVKSAGGLGYAAQNLVQKLGENYYASGAMKSLATAAVSYIL